jgi:hypothetical protein
MTHKIVSQLDADGHFIGPSFAYESPLERGVFLIPAGAVDVPVPEIPSNQWAKLVDGKWEFGDFVVEVSQAVEEVHLNPVEKLKQFLVSNPDVAALVASEPQVQSLEPPAPPTSASVDAE